MSRFFWRFAPSELAVWMIQLFRVSKIYPPNYPALTDIHLHVEKGEFVFLSGPSGAGKTTLLKLLFLSLIHI